MKTHEEARAKLREMFETLNLKASVSKPTVVGRGARQYNVTIWYDCVGPTDRHTYSYSMGAGLDYPPDPAEVLACVCREWLDAQIPFEGWASSCGYDPDSRKAEQVWSDCRAYDVCWLSRGTIEELAGLHSQL